MMLEYKLSFNFCSMCYIYIYTLHSAMLEKIIIIWKRIKIKYYSLSFL